VRGPLEPETDFVCDLGELDSLVTRLILDRLDHQHLNTALPEFAPGKTNPSSEALVRWVHAQLESAFAPGIDLVRLRVEEDDDLAAEWRAEDP
jgi:6-pyruvoyltetrahydropterin/6-carboxytetrahydropterin synthase